jgi:hypothetical protein
MSSSSWILGTPGTSRRSGGLARARTTIGRVGAARISIAVAAGWLALAGCNDGGHGGGATSPGSILTQRYDAQRSGLNTRESTLSPGTVSATTFGKLFSCPLDGEAYAEPLVVAKLPIGSGAHNVVFVATENDSVFAFDADTNPCIQYWKTSFLATGVTTVPPADTGETGDINKTIGITGTPVIDPVTRTLYVVAATKETVGNGCSNSSPCYLQRLHALDLATGSEKLGGPAILSSAITVPGSGDTGDSTCTSSTGAVPFCPLRENQRPGLLLANGRVYIAWASHGDRPPYHGWVIGYDAADLTKPPVLFNATPDGNGGGIWMSGTGPSVDASGNLYVVTGNGTFDTAAPRSNYGESFIKLRTASGLSVVDFFTPKDQAALSAADFDLGSGGALVLPDAAGSAAHPHLVVGGDKQGILYLIDRDQMTGFDPGGDQIVQKLMVTPGSGCVTCGIFSTPLYWQGWLYVAAVGEVVKQYTLTNASLSTAPAQSGNDVFNFPGATPVISSNGATNGILWALDTSNNGTPNGSGSDGAAVLYAYDAVTLSKLFSSPTRGAGAAGDAVKFAVPTVVNGKVYVGTQTELSVFGLLPH